MTEVIERVATLEEQAKASQGRIADIWTVLEKLTETTQAIATQISALVVVSEKQHTPESCPYRNDIRSCVEALWFARGSGKLILWLLGGGLLAIGAIIDHFVKAVHP